MSGETRLRTPVVAFAVALAVWAALFVGIDYAIMKMMGLTLIYHG